MQPHNPTPQIIPYNPSLRNEILQIWETSVLATHTFVSAADMLFFKEIVAGIDFATLSTHCLRVEDATVGFLAVSHGGKIEMLFLSPEHTGKRLGARLVDFALSQLGATLVDVNEQNARAVKFYEGFGFRTFERAERDATGKPYPILSMRLETASG